MEKGRNMNELLALVKALSSQEKTDLVQEILEMMSEPKAICVSVGSSASCNKLVSERHGKERPDCPHCGAKADQGFVYKRGVSKGVQRYSCKACGRFFVATTNTTFQGTRKSSETWSRFIGLTISGASIAVCAEECGLAIQTAFNWRHKVLNAFKSVRKNVQMGGRVEIDEMFIPISYKGNRVKGPVGTSRVRLSGEENYLPRKSYRRGSDNKPKSPMERACVFCMVSNGNAFYGSVPGVGQMTPNMLDVTLAKHVKKDDAKVLADQYKITVKYLTEKGYSFRSLASNTSDNPHEHKPEIVNGEHLQHVNAMHQQIRKFLRPYGGVASKYLDNYIALFVWLKNTQAIKKRKQIKSLSLSRAASSGCYIKSRDIHAYPVIPSMVAVA